MCHLPRIMRAGWVDSQNVAIDPRQQHIFLRLIRFDALARRHFSQTNPLGHALEHLAILKQPLLDISIIAKFQAHVVFGAVAAVAACTVSCPRGARWWL